MKLKTFLPIEYRKKAFHEGLLMQEHNQKLFQYFILDFQWIISDCNVVICLVWIGIWVWLGLVVYHYHLFRIIGLVFEIV